ncbi:hypothetical protein LCGC14_0144940 [marine sediment metagenome]|uniref:Uncharacterized protein n=1 Tax=marine sediment metagenome TaxID=412755 RepID=A0A0F9VF54_9ZZZZ
MIASADIRIKSLSHMKLNRLSIPDELYRWWVRKGARSENPLKEWSDTFAPAYIEHLNMPSSQKDLEKLMGEIQHRKHLVWLIGPLGMYRKVNEPLRMCSRRIIYDYIVHGDYRLAPRYPDYWLSGEYKNTTMYSSFEHSG